MTPPHFYIFVIISPLKRTRTFNWTKLNSLHLRIIFSTLIDFGLLVLEKILKNVQCIFTFLLPPPWRWAIPFIWTNFNPSSQIWFVSSLVKIGAVVLEKTFKRPHPNFTFLCLSPLWRGPGPLFEQIWIPFT
jgi:hypothetical protein